MLDTRFWILDARIAYGVFCISYLVKRISPFEAVTAGIIFWRAGQDRGFGSAKCKVESAKLWNPDVVGMAVLIVASLAPSKERRVFDIGNTPDL